MVPMTLWRMEEEGGSPRWDESSWLALMLVLALVLMPFEEEEEEEEGEGGASSMTQQRSPFKRRWIHSRVWDMEVSAS